MKSFNSNSKTADKENGSVQNKNDNMGKNNRRGFLQKAGAITATAFFSSLGKPAWAKNLEGALRDAEGVSAAELW